MSSSPTSLVIVGAGGFGREAVDTYLAARAAGALDAELIGVADDAISDADAERLQQLGVRHLGTRRDLSALSVPFRVAVAIGDPAVRSRVSRACASAGYEFQTLVHPTAVIGSLNTMGAGSILCAGSIVSTSVRLGVGVHLNPGATIGHDAILEDGVSINPGAVISGNVVVEREALIGAGAVVLQGIRIGAGAIVGASACVTRDVPAGTTVKGVPAR